MTKTALAPMRDRQHTKLTRFALLALAICFGAIAPIGSAEAASLAKKFQAKGSQTLDHSAFEALLQRYVVENADGVNRVNYRGLKKEHAKLGAYIAQLESVRVPSLSPDAAKAYWMNLYNAKTLDVVLDHYPVASIRDIKLGGLFSRGPWKTKILTVGGLALSLDDVEHEIARKSWKDARMHYGFNCASIGCPNLLKTPFTAANLNQQLNRAAQDFINHPRGVSVSASGVTSSKIYQWYKSDFGTPAQLRAHWLTYANASLKTKLNQQRSINGYRYEWSLNGAR